MKHQKLEATDEFLSNANSVLRLLMDSQTFILASSEFKDATVFEEIGKGGELQKLFTTPRALVEKLKSSGLLRQSQIGQVERYALSQNGRNAYPLELSDIEETADPLSAKARLRKSYVTETPVRVLARKKDKFGHSYISSRLVQAAERLHEDYLVSGFNEEENVHWMDTIERCAPLYDSDDFKNTQDTARYRWAAAMKDLGPGLCDIAYLVCCHEIGLELAEKKLEWSARSGKIVLRIALIRLSDFYEIPETKPS